MSGDERQQGCPECAKLRKRIAELEECRQQLESELAKAKKISPSRGSKVLVDVLGEEFNGILGCDDFSAYRKYMKDFNILVQFCLAHFVRDVKFLLEHPDKRNRIYGQRLLEDLRKLFGVIHRRDPSLRSG